MLGTVVASVDQGDADVNQFVELAIERAAHACVKRQKVFQHIGTVGERLLRVARFAAKRLFVDLRHFGRSAFRGDQRNASHRVLQKSRSLKKSAKTSEPFS